jgi:uncharacterized pyridoxal phosphate-containing UPF0001 family protein
MNAVLTSSWVEVQKRIESAARRVGRDPKAIRLVAVTKGVSPDRIREAISAGATLFGESRIQEALPKIKELSSFPGKGEAPSGSAGGGGMVASPINWHMVGHLQRNKAKDAVGVFELIHSVDGFELAHELDRRAGQKGVVQKILIQVNVAKEPTKHGVASEELEAMLKNVAGLSNLLVEGLMTIPPQSDDPEAARPYFRWLARKRDELNRAGWPLQELSMGMSGDFEVAIEEGATLIRVGTAIFGPR